MTTVVLLAPGPSMSAALAECVRGHRVGVINNSFELAPWAEFLAANDSNWWRRHPQAKGFAGRRFSANRIAGVEQIKAPLLRSNSNSGVLALECAKHLGAQRVLLLGFDMHGTHFFGPYTNGCGNTTEDRRAFHQKQYQSWAAANRDIDVINCTDGSALRAFRQIPLEKCL